MPAPREGGAGTGARRGGQAESGARRGARKDGACEGGERMRSGCAGGARVPVRRQERRIRGSTAVRTGGVGPTEHGRDTQQIHVTTRDEKGGHGRILSVRGGRGQAVSGCWIKPFRDVDEEEAG
ncbi:hypothetical protein GCM10010371_34140 [Streptomyces subrutilus]|uniref:Uncharacterized protein n=1 Tax=Streptomyces subrutilus TaxID=36818 RepID=A0A918QSW0_9ACTN|nr:hypothetical protein GCM10010371_34140 [Streptomyces subrutilus]